MREHFRREKGFTLLEIMLVLFIISLVAISVIFTLRPGDNDAAKKFAYQLQQKVTVLSNEAIMSGREYALFIQPAKRQVTFLQASLQGWKPVDHVIGVSQFANQMNWPQELHVKLKQKKEYTLFNDEMFAPLFEATQKYSPQVILGTMGDVTDFSLLIQDQDKHEWWLSVKNGEVVLNAIAPQNH